jgi:hypothetical protein
MIGDDGVEKFKKVFSALDLEFTPFWDKSSKHLSSWEKYFNDNQNLIKEILVEIKKLSGVDNFSLENIPIYLISDPFTKYKEINAWFSWTPNKSFMVIEIPINTNPSDLFPIGVLVHEFFHLTLRKNKNLINSIENIVNENNDLLVRLADGMPSKMFFEELLISSFIPEGYFNEKYFGIKISDYSNNPNCLLEWRQFVAHKMKSFSKEYVENSNKIDEKYLRDLLNLIKNPTL